MNTGETAFPTCASCVAFAALQKDAKGVAQGYCRRNPPTPLLLVTPSAVLGGPPNAQVMASYATTTAEQWCMEHTTPQEYVALRSGDE